MSGGWREGRTIAGAADLAAQDINSEPALLDGKKLEYTWKDSGCTSLDSLVATGQLFEESGEIEAVIGPGCSSGCESSAFSLTKRNVTQVSFGCTDSSLSDKQRYPTVRNMDLPRAPGHASMCTLALLAVQAHACTCTCECDHANAHTKTRPRAHTQDFHTHRISVSMCSLREQQLHTSISSKP